MEENETDEKVSPEEIERRNFVKSDTAKLMRHFKKLGYTRAEIKLKVGAEMARRKNRGK